MSRSSVSVTIVGRLFVAMGVFMFAVHLQPILAGHAVQSDGLAVELAAIVAGVFLLRGRNWARWLAAAWMALHIAITWGEPRQLALHAAIFAAIAFILFRPQANAHFS
jgi:hypothetical protein